MVFFTDRDLGPRIFPSELRAAGVAVEVHEDHFAPAAPDEAWLPRVAERGWIVLTNDQNIPRRVREHDALMAAGAAVIVLVGGDAPARELATNFVNSLQEVRRIVETTPRPFIAKLYRPNPKSGIAQGRPGEVRVVMTSALWKPGRRSQ